MPILGVGEKGHLQRVAAAVEETRAGAGKVTRIGTYYRSHAFMYRVLDQVAAIARAQAADKSSRASVPGSRISNSLQVPGRCNGLEVNRTGGAVLIHPALPSRGPVERFVGFRIKWSIDAKRLCRGKARRKKGYKQNSSEFGGHFYIVN